MLRFDIHVGISYTLVLAVMNIVINRLFSYSHMNIITYL